jgi:hypothetical protein
MDTRVYSCDLQFKLYLEQQRRSSAKYVFAFHGQQQCLQASKFENMHKRSQLTINSTFDREYFAKHWADITYREIDNR